MNEQEEILKENFNEYFELADKALSEKKYNSSVTLFFKSIVAASDIFVLKKEGFVPSSHKNRFLILKEKYKEIYNTIDKDFPFYQDSYIKKADAETEILKEDAKKLKTLAGI